MNILNFTLSYFSISLEQHADISVAPEEQRRRETKIVEVSEGEGVS